MWLPGGWTSAETSEVIWVYIISYYTDIIFLWKNAFKYTASQKFRHT